MAFAMRLWDSSFMGSKDCPIAVRLLALSLNDSMRVANGDCINVNLKSFKLNFLSHLVTSEIQRL